VELLVAPILVASATLVARRWGERAGGAVSAFPAIVGPVLLIVALAHGAHFAARAANATLLGLVSLAAFAVVYARLAGRHGWGASLLGGWACAALAALTTGLLAGGSRPPAGLLIAGATLALAHRALPVAPAAPIDAGAPAGPIDAGRPRRPGRGNLPLRMASAALLVAVLSAAAGALGAVAGGMLSALPVLACVLAVFTHRDQGPGAATLLLRGMLAGMPSFVIFCQLIAMLIASAGIAPAFAAATAAALAGQAATVYAPAAVHSLLRRQSSAANSAVAAAAGSLTRQSS